MKSEKIDKLCEIFTPIYEQKSDVETKSFKIKSKIKRYFDTTKQLNYEYEKVFDITFEAFDGIWNYCFYKEETIKLFVQSIYYVFETYIGLDKLEVLIEEWDKR